MRRLLVILSIMVVGLVSGQPPATWTVDPNSFEHFMTVTAVLEINDRLSTDRADVVAAFVGSECRGVAEATSSGDSWRYYLMVRANSGGETVTFLAWDASLDTILDVTNSVQFVASGAFGTVDEPYVLDAVNNTVAIAPESHLPVGLRLYQNYPNPFNPVTTISYELAEQIPVKLTIYDYTGRLVTTLVDGVETPGNCTAQWNGTNAAGQPVSSGTYLYFLIAGSEVRSGRMVLIK